MQRRRSTGEMISTLCFLGVGAWALGVALESSWPKGIALGICSAACFAGAGRHVIARLLASWR